MAMESVPVAMTVTWWTTYSPPLVGAALATVILFPYILWAGKWMGR